MMKTLNYICSILVLIGALNWGLIGAFNFNLVSVLFGIGTLTRVIYLLIGLSALFVIFSVGSRTTVRKN